MTSPSPKGIKESWNFSVTPNDCSDDILSISPATPLAHLGGPFSSVHPEPPKNDPPPLTPPPSPPPSPPSAQKQSIQTSLEQDESTDVFTKRRGSPQSHKRGSRSDHRLKWYYLDDRQERNGPFSSLAMVDMLRRNIITWKTHTLFKPGGREWVRLKRQQRLKRIISSIPPPPSSPPPAIDEEKSKQKGETMIKYDFADGFDVSFRAKVDSTVLENLGLEAPSLQYTFLDGYLEKRSPNSLTKKWQRRWFYLFEKKLYYFQPDSAYPSNCIDLADCGVVPASMQIEDSETRFCFEICSQERIFILAAPTNSDRVCWVGALLHNKRVQDDDDEADFIDDYLLSDEDIDDGEVEMVQNPVFGKLNDDDNVIANDDKSVNNETDQNEQVDNYIHHEHDNDDDEEQRKRALQSSQRRGSYSAPVSPRRGKGSRGSPSESQLPASSLINTGRHSPFDPSRRRSSNMKLAKLLGIDSSPRNSGTSNRGSGPGSSFIGLGHKNRKPNYSMSSVSSVFSNSSDHSLSVPGNSGGGSLNVSPYIGGRTNDFSPGTALWSLAELENEPSDSRKSRSSSHSKSKTEETQDLDLHPDRSDNDEHDDDQNETGTIFADSDADADIDADADADADANANSVPLRQIEEKERRSSRKLSKLLGLPDGRDRSQTAGSVGSRHRSHTNSSISSRRTQSNSIARSTHGSISKQCKDEQQKQDQGFEDLKRESDAIYNDMLAGNAAGSKRLTKLEKMLGSRQTLEKVKDKELELRQEEEIKARMAQLAVNRHRSFSKGSKKKKQSIFKKGKSMIQRIFSGGRGHREESLMVDAKRQNLLRYAAWNLSDYVNTGDLLLFRTRKQFSSKIIREWTDSVYDHVAAIIVVQGDTYILEASRNGVCASGWGARYSELDQVFKLVAVRHLQTSTKYEASLQACRQKMIQFFDKVQGKQYGISLLKFMSKNEAAYDEEDRTFFCSELVAALYKECGLLRKDIPSSTYTPASFSESQSDKIFLLKGATLSPEFTLYFD